MYSFCEYCKVQGERRKSLPFGKSKEEAVVLFVLPYFFDSVEESIRDFLVETYPDARFVTFVACNSVEDLGVATLACGVILRNEFIGMKRIILPKQLFDEAQTKIDGGVAFGYYDGHAPLKPGTIEEYKRVLNAEV